MVCAGSVLVKCVAGELAPVRQYVVTSGTFDLHAQLFACKLYHFELLIQIVIRCGN